MKQRDKICISAFSVIITLNALLMLANIYEVVGWSVTFRCIIVIITLVVICFIVLSTGWLSYEGEPKADLALVIYLLIILIFSFIFYKDIPYWFSPFTGYGK